MLGCDYESTFGANYVVIQQARHDPTIENLHTIWDSFDGKQYIDGDGELTLLVSVVLRAAKDEFLMRRWMDEWIALRQSPACLYVIKNDLLLFVLILNVKEYL